MNAPKTEATEVTDEVEQKSLLDLSLLKLNMTLPLNVELQNLVSYKMGTYF